MQVPPEGSSKAECEAQWSNTPGPQEQQTQPPQPPSLPQLPPQQQHPPPLPTADSDDITVRVLSELPLAGSQAVLQPQMPSGLSDTFSRLAVGWSPSAMQLETHNGEDGGRQDAVHPGDITSSGIFKRLDSMQPLRGIAGVNRGT